MFERDTLSNMSRIIDKITRKIIFNTISQFGSKVVSVLLSLLSVSLLTRYLGEAGYGNYTLVFTYLTFFGLIADVGFNVTLVREFSSHKNLEPKIKATFFNIKLILILLSIILPIVVLVFFPYSPFLKTAIIVGAITVAVGNMISYGTSILQSDLRLDRVALIDLITKLVTVLATIYFIYTKSSLYNIIGAIFIGNIVGLATTFYSVREYIVFLPYIDLSLCKKLYKIAIPLGITSILSLIYFKIDTIFLSLWKTPVDVGVYGLAYNILENILMLWGLFMANIFPLLSKYFAEANAILYKSLLKKTFISLVCMSVIIIFFGNIFDYLIMRILGGSKFFSSMMPFKILLWSVPFFFLNNVFYNVIISFGKTKHLIPPLIISFVINIILNVYAIPKYGYIGASYTTVITEIITSVTYGIILYAKFQDQKQYFSMT
jgi:O-antigen/teichoic acid export membrane protein